MEQEICCVNFKGLLAYLRHHYGEQGVSQATAGLVDNRFLVRDVNDPTRVLPIRIEHLADPAYWVSNEFSLALFEQVSRLIAGPNPLLTAGAGAVRESFSRTVLLAARLLGVRRMAQRVSSFNARFNRTKDVELLEFTANRVVFRLHYRPGMRVSRHVCDWNLGIYTEIARVAGCHHVQGHESGCVLEGDAGCTFVITWRGASWLQRLTQLGVRSIAGRALRDMLAEYEQAMITRERLIEQLSRSEEKYRAFFEDSLDAMSLTRDQRLSDVNPAWLRLHGYDTKQEVLNRDVLEFLHPDDRPLLQARRHDEQQRRLRSYRLRDRRRDGSAVDVEVFSSRIAYGGETAILATVRDISEIKQAEAKRQQLEQRLLRSEKMQALAALAGGVAHDLNNILAGIVGYPDLMLADLPADSPLRQPILAMQQSGRKAVAVVQDLLTLARRDVARFEPVDLNRIVTDYMASPELERLRGQHPRVEIRAALSETLPMIQGSPVHLSKALMNLVLNAAEAMPGGGSVVIASAPRRLEQPIDGVTRIEAGEYALLSVTDTGVGILPADRQRIFEPFFTRKVMGHSGSGLGMTVVWGTVQDHAGAIDLSSAEGRGTSFELYFPASAPAGGAVAPADAERRLPLGSGQRVLVVDDVAEQREIASAMLRFLGYEAETVISGEQALTWLDQHRCDLLLLDMIMPPGIDGLETYRRAVAAHPGLRAVIATGFTESGRRAAARVQGLDEFLEKPYSLEQLAHAMQRALAA
jgi:PAS domain S-box-containing protein